MDRPEPIDPNMHWNRTADAVQRNSGRVTGALTFRRLDGSFVRLGRALITGRWADIGKVQRPHPPRPGRAPYFHNGFAADLDAVLEFYEDHFAIEFTDQRADRPARVLARSLRSR